jgi:hypothetical protein
MNALEVSDRGTMTVSPTAWADSGPRASILAFVAFIIELGALSAAIWTGHADLRSIDEVYLFAVLILFRSGSRRLGALALVAGLATIVAATHQALYL